MLHLINYPAALAEADSSSGELDHAVYVSIRPQPISSTFCLPRPISNGSRVYDQQESRMHLFDNIGIVAIR